MLVEVKGAEEVFEYLKKSSENFEKKLVAKVTKRVKDKTKENAKPHSTGRLNDNISSKIKNLTGEVYIENDGMLTTAGVNYGIFVHFGARPHPITPTNRKALRWEGDNSFIFAKKVKHPGYKGDPFMYKALETTIKRLNEIARKVADETF